MRTKKKKQSSNKTLPLLIIAVLIGLMPTNTGCWTKSS